MPSPAVLWTPGIPGICSLFEDGIRNSTVQRWMHDSKYWMENNKERNTRGIISSGMKFLRAWRKLRETSFNTFNFPVGIRTVQFSIPSQKCWRMSQPALWETRKYIMNNIKWQEIFVL
jgi:hypothetical protein